jgi:hypothetical protein
MKMKNSIEKVLPKVILVTIKYLNSGKFGYMKISKERYDKLISQLKNSPKPNFKESNH